MEKVLRDTLIDLGLTEKEIIFFLTNYTLGAATINEIVKRSGIERSTAYLIAQELIKKGFIIEDFKQYKKLLITIEPKTLLRMLAAKQRKVGRHELALQENLPTLQANYLASEIRPRVRTYEGNTGILAIWRDILSLPQEVLLWTNQETETKFFTKDHHQLFIQERLKKNVSLRVLTVNNAKGKLLKKFDTTSLRETKLLPENTFFSSETYLYGDKMATLDYNKDSIGVVIESEQIVQAQRAIFEMTWRQIT